MSRKKVKFSLKAAQKEPDTTRRLNSAIWYPQMVSDMAYDHFPFGLAQLQEYTQLRCPRDMRCPSYYLKEQLRNPMNLDFNNWRTRGSVKVALSKYAAAEKKALSWSATRLCSKSPVGVTTCHPPYRVRTVIPARSSRQHALRTRLI